MCHNTLTLDNSAGCGPGFSALEITTNGDDSGYMLSIRVRDKSQKPLAGASRSVLLSREQVEILVEELSLLLVPRTESLERLGGLVRGTLS